MDLISQYDAAQRLEDVARLRRLVILRAMVATGMSQREIAASLGTSQPAVSQKLKLSAALGHVHPETLLEAAAPVIKAVAEEHGYARLAVFGSVARHQARPDSDIDLLVEVPDGTSSFGMIRFQQLLEQILGRDIDLISYGGLKPRLDDDIRHDAVLL